jgi:hypothetical protein
VAPNTAINSNFYVAQNNATLDIVYRDGSSTQQQKSWLWSVDGTLTLPTAGRINFDYLSISSDANVSAFYAPAGNVQLAAGIGDAQIVANSLNDSKTWTFGNTGNLTIPGNINFANGVNILSTVGAGAYGNAQVAAYLLNFDGDIEFTSSTAKIGNVDVITVMDSIRSPAYQFSNGVSILSTVTGTYSNVNVEAYIGGNIGSFQTYSNANVAGLRTSINSLVTNANTNTAAYLAAGISTNITTTGNVTVGGNIIQQGAYYETYGNISNSGGNLTCNFNLGTTFYAALGANVTANFTNVNATTSSVTGATIIVDQGATAYRVANVQVNGVNQTIRWVGASAGVGTASNTDVMSFSLIHLGGGAYRVLGQISNYG